MRLQVRGRGNQHHQQIADMARHEAWSGLKEGLEAAGPANFAGKLVIDVTNPLDFSTGAPRLAIALAIPPARRCSACCRRPRW